jgi:hypothetical protein
MSTRARVTSLALIATFVATLAGRPSSRPDLGRLAAGRR